MNRISSLLLSLLFLPGCAVTSSAQDAKTCFLEMPDSLSLLSAVSRADCIDFLENKMKAEVTNRLGSKSEMKVLTGSYILLQSTPQSTWQMKLLPVSKKKQVICVISTACAPACDSHIRFYSTDWQELNAQKYLSELPTVEDFLHVPSDTVATSPYQESRRQADITLLKAELSANENSLHFILTTPDYMEKSQADKLRPYLKQQLTYQWMKKKFLPKE